MPNGMAKAILGQTKLFARIYVRQEHWTQIESASRNMQMQLSRRLMWRGGRWLYQVFRIR